MHCLFWADYTIRSYQCDKILHILRCFRFSIKSTHACTHTCRPEPLYNAGTQVGVISCSIWLQLKRLIAPSLREVRGQPLFEEKKKGPISSLIFKECSLITTYQSGMITLRRKRVCAILHGQNSPSNLAGGLWWSYCWWNTEFIYQTQSKHYQHSEQTIQLDLTLRIQPMKYECTMCEDQHTWHGMFRLSSKYLLSWQTLLQ